EAGDDRTVLRVREEGLRQGGLAGVVGETARLPMTASRRLQLAAEASGVIGLVIRRWRSTAEAAGYGAPTASTTRWRIVALPSTPLPVPGVGRARWRVELVRCRGGEPASWDLEACDAQGHLAVPADMAHRPIPAATRLRGAAG
ncbi:ImuA family protein, partial [Vineibacter terrae]|uniref:ImuA family protein n=1 Tax=Vineibacter terrae TaxID=2586908 RepID=UPI002E610B87|nr:damage-inducible protein [Vineibacter terrae]